jgi:hypothetical protein
VTEIIYLQCILSWEATRECAPAKQEIRQKKEISRKEIIQHKGEIKKISGMRAV